MAHQIETHTTETGELQAAAIYARQDAWHKLGTTVTEAFTAEDAMTIGHLGGWNIRKAPLTTTDITDDGVPTIEVPDRYATVRTNPFTGASEALGVVGNHYTPIQNEEHAEFLNALVDESGAHFETAGSLRGGREVFITMKMPDHMLVGDTDPVDLYLAAVNSHDGTSSFRLMVSPVRVVCANTLAMALRDNKGVHSVRHTVNATQAIGEARRALDLSFAYLDEFQAEAERMIQTSLTKAQFSKIITAEFGAEADASEAVQTRRGNMIDQMMTLFAEAGTQKGVRNTRWAGYNAITEYADHFQPVFAKGGDVAEVRAQRVILGAGADIKQRAFELFRVNA